MSIWWFVLAGGIGALAFFARRGQNAVWGTASLALIVGIGIAFFQPGFAWLTVAKSVAIGALIGVALETLPMLTKNNTR